MIVKDPEFPTLESMTQLISLPPPAGSGSLSVRLVAAAVPTLLIVTVKPETLPAVTMALSADFVTAREGAELFTIS